MAFAPYQYGGQGMLGDRYTGGQGMRLAALLARQNVNNGSTMGGLANVLQQALIGMSLKGDADASNLDRQQQAEANAAMARGMAAKPWVNPDTGAPTIQNDQGASVPTAQAGGYAGGLAALGNMPENPYAGRLASQLAMGKFGQDAKTAQDALNHQQALALKAAPGWEKPTTPLPGRDVPYPKEVAEQLTNIAGARAAAMREPPKDYAPNPDGPGVSFVPGGPADPATIAARVAAEQSAKPQEGDKPASAEAAKTIGLVDSGIYGVKNLEQLVFDGEGKLNQEAVFASRLPWGGLSDSGKKIATAAYMAADAELRLKTGAQAPQSEIERSARALMPDVTDSADTARTKLNALKTYLESVDRPLRPSKYKPIDGITPPPAAGGVPALPPGFVVVVP